MRRGAAILIALALVAGAGERLRAAPGEVLAESRIAGGEGGFGGTLLDFNWFGAALARIGDLDGDGVDEWAVGAPRGDGPPNTGAVWILFMNADGSVASQVALHAGLGLAGFDRFGEALAPVGDLDGDGVPDLAVGAPRHFSGCCFGAVFVLFLETDGSVSGFRKLAAADLASPPAASGGFGSALAAAGDLEAGGLEALAVGSPDDDRVYLLSLAADGSVQPGGETTVTLPAEPLVIFGAGVASLGDIDANGADDLAVGDPFDGDGAVWIVRMNADGSVSAATRFAPPDEPGSPEFGRALATLGDLDADGVRELAVGAALSGDGGVDVGAVWILSVAADGSASVLRRISATSGGLVGPLADEDYFGLGLAAPGDLGGDGVPDLLAGAPRDGFLDRGAVWVLHLDGVPDRDGDGVPDADDVCPDVPDEAQRDSDGDGLGDPCDVDRDGDGINDLLDPDLDGDGVANVDDNCSGVPNPGQEDGFGGPRGDACDVSPDPDCAADPQDGRCGRIGVTNGQNGDSYAYRWRDRERDYARRLPIEVQTANGYCTYAPHPQKPGFAAPGVIDASELSNIDFLEQVVSGSACCVWESRCVDEVGAGRAEGCACAPPGCTQRPDGTALGVQFHAWGVLAGTAPTYAGDADVFPDPCDNCPGVDNDDQADADGDGIGDACEQDDDADGHPDVADLCPTVPDPAQGDADGDGVGDACDVCPAVADPGQDDTDGSGLGDACNDALDADGDEHEDALDRCPSLADDQVDTDGDGTGDACEPLTELTRGGCYRVTDTIGPAGPDDPVFDAGLFTQGSGQPFADGVATIDLPFDFAFYGETRDSVDLSRDGFLSFAGLSGPGPGDPLPLPGDDAINGIVAGIWTELGEGDGFHTSIQGSAPDRRVLIQLDHHLRAHNHPNDPTNAPLLRLLYVLHEASHEIEVHYDATNGSGGTRINPALVGIESPDGREGLSWAGPGAFHLVGQAIRFAPQPSIGLETDGDGIRDCLDSCPFLPNALEQTDTNDDGTGDLCQCGDVDDDGDVDPLDVERLRETRVGINLLDAPQKCNTVGPVDPSDPDGDGLWSDCGLDDLVVIRRLASGHPTPDPARCQPAVP